VGAWRSGGAVEFQGGGGSPTIDGGFLVFLPHEEEEGELRLRGGRHGNGRQMGLIGGRSSTAVAAPILTREGFSGEPEWTMGFIWDEDGVMHA
jgi:hypothetical protein